MTKVISKLYPTYDRAAQAVRRERPVFTGDQHRLEQLRQLVLGQAATKRVDRDATASTTAPRARARAQSVGYRVP